MFTVLVSQKEKCTNEIKWTNVRFIQIVSNKIQTLRGEIAHDNKQF